MNLLNTWIFGNHAHAWIPRRLAGLSLIVVLSVVIGCGVSGGSTTASPTPSPLWPYGGPYPIGASGTPNPTVAATKVAEFDAISNAGWQSSRTTKLTLPLLRDSIRKNNQGVKGGSQYQRYNYVVRGGDIYVAVWSMPTPTTVRNLCQTPSAGAPQTSYLDLQVQDGVMIDFFPEDSTQPPGNVRVNTGYCDLKAKTGSLSPGILDRHGKHFMLAQPEDKKLGDYAPSIGQQWVLAQVDYAGEILVRVNQNGCEYVLNNGSGTYGPNGKYLKDVAADRKSTRLNSSHT